MCGPNTQCLSFSGTKENRGWHEVSTFSLMKWTAQPEIQVLNFQQQTKGSCSSPVHWNQVTFISTSNLGSIYLLILLLSACLGVSSTCKKGKQIEQMTLRMKKIAETHIQHTMCSWMLSLTLLSPKSGESGISDIWTENSVFGIKSLVTAVIDDSAFKKILRSGCAQWAFHSLKKVLCLRVPHEF